MTKMMADGLFNVYEDIGNGNPSEYKYRGTGQIATNFWGEVVLINNNGKTLVIMDQSGIDFEAGFDTIEDLYKAFKFLVFGYTGEYISQKSNV